MALKTKEEAWDAARKAAAIKGERYAVYEHCGDYGNPQGDVKATHEFKVAKIDEEQPRFWAFIGFEPEIMPHKFIAIGAYCWGKGDTIAEAKKHCLKNQPTYLKGKKEMNVYKVHPDTYVNEGGGLCYPKNFEPQLC